MNKEIISKNFTNEGYIIYSKTDDRAIEVIDKQKGMITWTDRPACYRVYKTEAEARKDIKYAQMVAEEYLEGIRHLYAEDDLPILNAMIISNRLADADVYKVKKAIKVDIEGV